MCSEVKRPGERWHFVRGQPGKQRHERPCCAHDKQEFRPTRDGGDDRVRHENHVPVATPVTRSTVPLAPRSIPRLLVVSVRTSIRAILVEHARSEARGMQSVLREPT